MPSSAVVVGAGIAGLSAAIALRRAGWRVTVLERSRFSNEIGAAISVPPNATRALDRWGFDAHAAGGVPNVSARFARADNLAVILNEDYADIAERMGAASWSFHRVDLHRGLRELATRQDGEGDPVEVRLGAEAVGVDCGAGVVRLNDDTLVEGELIVIADGAHVGSLTSLPNLQESSADGKGKKNRAA